MELNTNFDAAVLVHGADLEWVDSPMAGVQRRMLDRIGGEVARATSIVRYAPDSHFSPHVHTGGEEFVVLTGVFQDEHGDFPAGSYIRNPPESSHTPGSAEGCIIFVKLWQFDPADRTHVRLQTSDLADSVDLQRRGVRVTPLFEDERETVQLENWDANAQITVAAPEGAELLVLEGSARGVSTTASPDAAAGTESRIAGEEMRVQSWLRLPMGSAAMLQAGPAGATVWCKYRHLRFVAPPGESAAFSAPAA